MTGRDRVRHVAADPGRHPAALHGTGGKAVEPGHAVTVAGHTKGGTAFNLFVRNLSRLSVDIDLTFPRWSGG